jgi:adenine-specific DNA-methyltransferase
MAKKKSAKSKSAAADQKTVEAITHDDKRRNIPTAELQAVVKQEHSKPKQVKYPRNTDLDPQLVWRGKDEQDWSDLVVHAPPLYIQEKVHPKALIDDLLRQSGAAREVAQKTADKATGKKHQLDLFADFNGVPEGADKTDFYQHDQNWSNRMILGDSLQVMASLAEREGLRGRVQCIYFDPPYGIKFNSNFQWSTTSRDVKDGKADHITREPEQVKAFRDTWRDGIHSYLTYLRDRLTVARDLLTDSGSIFVQIGDENVHRVRAVLDDVFGDENMVGLITVVKTSSASSEQIAGVADYILFYAKDKKALKYRSLLRTKSTDGDGGDAYRFVETDDYLRMTATDAEKHGKSINRHFRLSDLRSNRPPGSFPVQFEGRTFTPKKGFWKTGERGFGLLLRASRLQASANTLNYVRYIEDYPAFPINNVWTDLSSSVGSEKVYVVQTGTSVVERCLLMATDPGDLVLDPTCGSGTTTIVAEQWGRRWITIDTSRVALALARARIMGARYPYYLLSDSTEGQAKEAEVTHNAPSTRATYGKVRQGFVYERVPHITLKSIANNAEIDVIWDKWESKIQAILGRIQDEIDKSHQLKPGEPPTPAPQEWQIPREVDPKASAAAKKAHAEFWQARIARQKEIDASIAAKAEFEYLYDKPYEDKKKVRVAGPFTVESLSPHRMLGVGENGELLDPLARKDTQPGEKRDFAQMILENLRTAGVQQAHKEDRITFTSIVPWPGSLICAEGRYMEGDIEKRAAIFIGPEFGTVQRQDLVQAAIEAAEARFGVVIACAFNYEARTTELKNIGAVPILQARMNADLHMAGELKTTNKANLFVIFGEPDITILPQEDGQICVKVNGVDVFDPSTGEVRSDGADGIACWFIDTDYNDESFFVRHAYFLGQNDPYGALKTSLKAEINQEAWESLNSDTSRPFEKPKSGRVAVKVINHLGDEVMKVFGVK